ncbi:MAG: GNAT family N-acetyltransferase [Candidatus Thorarchaeota archaeon]
MNKKITDRVLITKTPTDEEMMIVQKRLEDYKKQFPNGELDIPTPDISLVLKNSCGTIVGGVITSMLTGVMHLEVLWIDEMYRGRGYGRALVLQAESIGKEKGYPASQTWTFSFQAPEFYQRIGYKLVGTFDGYTNGITEHILLKKFKSDEKPYYVNRLSQDGFSICEDASEESMKILHEGLHKYVTKHVGELRKKNLGIRINLVAKNEESHVIGGAHAYTTLRVVHTVQLWVDETYRNQGCGKELLSTVERIAINNGCISGLVNALSFESPEFFQKQGYEIFGVSDAYNDSILEYFLIKRF